MSKYVNRALIVTCFAALISISLAAQTVKSTGVKWPAGTPNPNFKSSSLANTPGKPVVAPQSKGGPAAKGAACVLHIDNSTGYIVEFYANGNAQGAISPWGDLTTTIISPGAQLYATVTFTNGTLIGYGPQQFTCKASPGPDAVFTWTLTP